MAAVRVGVRIAEREHERQRGVALGHVPEMVRMVGVATLQGVSTRWNRRPKRFGSYTVRSPLSPRSISGLKTVLFSVLIRPFRRPAAFLNAAIPSGGPKTDSRRLHQFAMPYSSTHAGQGWSTGEGMNHEVINENG